MNKRINAYCNENKNNDLILNHNGLKNEKSMADAVARPSLFEVQTFRQDYNMPVYDCLQHHIRCE